MAEEKVENQQNEASEEEEHECPDCPPKGAPAWMLLHSLDDTTLLMAFCSNFIFCRVQCS